MTTLSVDAGKTAVHADVALAERVRTVRERILTELRKIIDSAEVKNKLKAAGFEAFSSSEKELDDFVKVQLNKWGKMIKDAGIQPE